MLSPAKWPWQVAYLPQLHPFISEMKRIVPRVLLRIKDDVNIKHNTNMVKYSKWSKMSELHQHMLTWIDDQKLEQNQ